MLEDLVPATPGLRFRSFLPPPCPVPPHRPRPRPPPPFLAVAAPHSYHPTSHRRHHRRRGPASDPEIQKDARSIRRRAARPPGSIPGSDRPLGGWNIGAFPCRCFPYGGTFVLGAVGDGLLVVGLLLFFFFNFSLLLLLLLLLPASGAWRFAT